MSGWWQIHVYDDHDIVLGTVWFERNEGWSFRCKLTHGRSRSCLREHRGFLTPSAALTALAVHHEGEAERADKVRSFMRAATE